MPVTRLCRATVALVVLTLGDAALAATYTVDNTGDSGASSLRDAITSANANAGTDTILFGIGGVGPHVIEIATPLPGITETVIINGTSQSGASANTLSVGNDAVMMIVLRPSVGSAATSGLAFTTGNSSIVRGLVIQGFSSGHAILINGADNVSVMGNFLGTNAAGTAANPNDNGVFALNGAAGTVVGSALPADRNVISGNFGSGITAGNSTTTVTVHNNYIGTNAAGTAAIGNLVGLVLNSLDTADVGDETAGAGNLISGNGYTGIQIGGPISQVLVEGNLIGTNATGTGAIPNGSGIYVSQVSGFSPTLVRIGGATSPFYNTIAYNTGDGIAVFPNAPPPQGVLVAGNSIFSNGDLGIDLGTDGVTSNDVGDGDSGASALQNFPVITSATYSGGNITINGTLNSTASGNFDLRFFQSASCDGSGNGEGETYLGLTNVSTDGSGDATFSTTFAGSSVGVITATATDVATNGTSELSACQSVVIAAIPSITIDDPSVTEGNAATTTLTFTVTLSVTSASNVSVDWQTANDTTDGTDFAAASGTLTILAGATTGTIDIPVNGDVTVEPDDTLFVNLTNPVNATIGDTQGLGTIQNDDALPTVTITDVSQNEGSGGGTTAFTFTVTLSAPALFASSIDWATADNTADSVNDFTAANGTINFNVGEQSQPVTIDVNAETMYESDESFFVNFSNASNIDLNDKQAIGTIQNDDAIPTVTIADASTNEGNSGTPSLNFTVTLSNPSQAQVSVFFQTNDDTATQPSDYTTANGSFTVLSGQLTAQTGVLLVGDTSIEPDETFFLDLPSATGATIVDNQAIGTIVNDDGLATPSITISDPTVAEGNAGSATLSYIVTLSSSSASDVTVTYATADGSATSGSGDYVPATNTLTILSGSTTGQIDVTVNGDSNIETDETVLMNLSAPVNATISDPQGAGTIANDDGLATPGISISDVSMNEGNAGATVFDFTISLTQASASDVSVTATTADGSATAGGLSDYLAQTNTITILSGNTTETFSVAVNGDVLVEADEAFFVNLTNGVNGTIIDNQATGTIVNDDAVGAADLTIVKTGPATVIPGANIAYSIVVTNNGPAIATNVTVTDSIPAGTSFVSATPTQGSCAGTTTVTCTLGSLAVGASSTIALTVQAPSGPANLSNTAAATADQSDATPNASTAGTVVAAASVPAVPTLSGWMLLSLMTALAAAVVLKVRS